MGKSTSTGKDQGHQKQQKKGMARSSPQNSKILGTSLEGIAIIEEGVAHVEDEDGNQRIDVTKRRVSVRAIDESGRGLVFTSKEQASGEAARRDEDIRAKRRMATSRLAEEQPATPAAEPPKRKGPKN